MCTPAGLTSCCDLNVRVSTWQKRQGLLVGLPVKNKACMHSAGMTSLDFGGDTSVMYASDGATVTLIGCSFIGNTINGTISNSAIFSINAVNLETPHKQLQDTIVRLEQCSFTDNVAGGLLVTYMDYPFTEFSALTYSDITFDVMAFQGNSWTQSMTKPLSATPSGRLGISSTSPWLQSAQQVCSSGGSSLCTDHFN
jgi:hypothetical protein